MEFIQTDNYNILIEDPTEKFLKVAIKNSKSLINSIDKNKILQNTIHPQLYSVIKSQKEDYLIIPLLWYVTSTASKVSKCLNDNIIQECCNLKVKFSIKISNDLIERIQNVRLPEKA